jgi:purine-binding chemotaxis protein CheW
MEGILMGAVDISVRDEFLSFGLGAEQYAIDILRVREIRAHMPVTRIAHSAPSMKGIFDLRGTIVPVFDMRVLLGLPPADGVANPVVIILDIDGRPAGIVVDVVCQVVALERGSVKPVPSTRPDLDTEFIRGATSIDDAMIVVLDIARLMLTLDAPAREEAA